MIGPLLELEEGLNLDFFQSWKGGLAFVPSGAGEKACPWRLLELERRLGLGPLLELESRLGLGYLLELEWKRWLFLTMIWKESHDWPSLDAEGLSDLEPLSELEREFGPYSS